MSTFARSFSVDRINDRVLEDNPWFRDMLLYWRPAGDALHRDMTEAHKLASSGQMLEEDPMRLRLAIRNRYLNLYRGGQSIAKIEFGGNGVLQACIHYKYVYGDKGKGQSYVVLTSAGLSCNETGQLRAYKGPADLDRWIANANQYVGPEKRFVDLIVARNPDTIDLEMALPAYSFDPKERIAPRMDLVVLEPAGDRWRIVFWEAKRVDDARARCRGDDVPPKVVDQIEQYSRWLRHPKNSELVACAYQNVCRLVVEFHRLAKSVNSGIGELGPGIIATAAANVPPLVDHEPRLIIDDQAGNVPFTQGGHLRKLRDQPYNLHVQMVRQIGEMTLGPRA